MFDTNLSVNYFKNIYNKKNSEVLAKRRAWLVKLTKEPRYKKVAITSEKSILFDQIHLVFTGDLSLS